MTGNIFLKALWKWLATCSFNVNFKHGKCNSTGKSNTAKLPFNTLSSRFTNAWNGMARDFAGHPTVKLKVLM